jgi:hypothetical protein
MNIAASVEVQNSGKTFTIGKVSGTGKLGGSCTFSNGASVGANTWKVGNDDDWTTSVKVTSNANFVKIGKGKMTWNGVSDNTGTTTVSEGELKMGTSGQLGTGKLTVSQGAVLTLWSKPKALSNSAVTINGTLRIELSSGHNLKPGDVIQLWTAKTFTGTPTFELPEGYIWDTSRISEGVLVVKDIDTGIRPSTFNPQPSTLYDLNGRQVRQAGKGIYIRNGKKVVITK